MTKRYFLDANFFLRFLTADDKQKAEACRRLVKKAVDGELRLSTHPLVLAEVVWILESYYGLPRAEIAAKLEMILNTPICLSRKVMLLLRRSKYIHRQASIWPIVLRRRSQPSRAQSWLVMTGTSTACNPFFLQLCRSRAALM